jgi:hypothetical protein
MKRWFLILCSAYLLSATICAQTKPYLAKGIRPVFMSAERLAVLCQDWDAVHPGGELPKADDVLNVSPRQMIRGLSCEAYVLGVFDEKMEGAFGAHYHPSQSKAVSMKPFIDALLRYVKEHPEEAAFAGSTIVNKIGSMFRQF